MGTYWNGETVVDIMRAKWEFMWSGETVVDIMRAQWEFIGTVRQWLIL